MFGIACSYVKAKIKAPAFNIICKYSSFLFQKKTQLRMSFSEYVSETLAFNCDIATSYAEQPAPTTLRRTGSQTRASM
jgi:hypothetical protein